MHVKEEEENNLPPENKIATKKLLRCIEKFFCCWFDPLLSHVASTTHETWRDQKWNFTHHKLLSPLQYFVFYDARCVIGLKEEEFFCFWCFARGQVADWRKQEEKLLFSKHPKMITIISSSFVVCFSSPRFLETRALHTWREKATSKRCRKKNDCVGSFTRPLTLAVDEWRNENSLNIEWLLFFPLPRSVI